MIHVGGVVLDTEVCTVYAHPLYEEVDVIRPVIAIRLSNGEFKLLKPDQYDEEGEN